MPGLTRLPLPCIPDYRRCIQLVTTMFPVMMPHFSKKGAFGKKLLTLGKKVKAFPL